MKELKGLQVKFVVSNMIMVTLVIGLAFLAIGYVTKAGVEQSSRLPYDGKSAQSAQEYFSFDGKARLPYFVLITDSQQDVVRVEGQYRLEAGDEFVRFLAAESLSAAEDQGFLEPYQLEYSRRPIESGYMITYVDTSLGNAYTSNTWKVLGVIGAAVWLAFFAISCFLSKWAVRPVDSSIRREKQFVADASHELKTPLTVIMANAQLLSESGSETSIGDRKRWLSNICQEASQMKKLVEEMLALAKNEAVGQSGVREMCSLSDIVTESVLSFEAVFYQAKKELESQVEDEVYIKGDEKQLKHLMKILLDNAQKYSPEGGKARVELYKSGKRKARLVVANPGEAISKKEQKAIFDRFYRSDISRSDGKGYGLGLAIGKSIVEKHRGKMQVESAGGENRFSVEFPTLFHYKPL